MSEHEIATKSAVQLNDEMLSSNRTPTWRWYWLAFILGAIVAWGTAAFTYQMMTDMSVTGLDRPVMWGLYIANFVFWVGLSHSGTMVSAILRLSQANWRRPILRAAEAMTVFSITVAGLFPIIHLGRNWVVYFFIPYPNQRGIWPNFRSALLWDATAITTYIIGSSLFLYLGMLPDLAVVRDRSTGWKKKVYAVLAMGWRGTAREWVIFRQASTLMAALIIPVAVSVHSIVAWDFAVTIIPGWHSTIFPPYFVAGAIYSGFAMVLVLAIPLRAMYGLEDLITMRHLDNMAKVMLATGEIVAYSYVFEAFIAWYSGNPYEMFAMWNRMTGPYAPTYWLLIFCNLVFPQLLWWKKIRTNIVWLFVMSLDVLLGMWLERYVIIVVSLSRDYVPSAWGYYWPTIWDVATYVGTIGLFFFLFFLFIRSMPMISIFEVRTLLPQAEVTEGVEK